MRTKISIKAVVSPVIIYGCERWPIKKAKVKSQVVFNSLRPYGLYPTRFLSPWDSPGKEYWSRLPFPSPGDLPNPGIKHGSPALQADSLPAEAQAKPKNIGVGSISLLKQICPTQEWNQALLYCRQILYQLSYEGSLNHGKVLQKNWLGAAHEK